MMLERSGEKERLCDKTVLSRSADLLCMTHPPPARDLFLLDITASHTVVSKIYASMTAKRKRFVIIRKNRVEQQKHHTFSGGEIVEIRLNGESRFIEKGTKMTVASLLELEQVTSPEMVAVQINGEIVDRGRYHNTIVADRNEVDFLYFMAGG